MISKIKNKAKDWLLWSQKYTRMDMRYLSVSGFWTTLSHVSGVLFSFLMALAFANLLPKETYGQYKYVFSIVGILSIFTFTGMRDAVSRAVSRGQEGILKTAIKFQLRWSLIFIIATNIAGAYYIIKDNKILGIPLLVFAFIFPLAKTYSLYGSYITGKKDFRILTIYDFFSTLINSSAIIITLFLTDSLFVIIGIYALFDLLTAIGFYYLTIRKYKPSREGEDDVETIKYGAHLTFLSALGTIVQQIDKVIVFRYSGAIELAVYSVASALPERIKGFGKSIVALSYPKLAQRTLPEIRENFKLRIFQSLFFGTGIALAYILTAPLLFRLLMPQYMDAVFYSQILSLATMIMMPHFYVGCVILAQKMTRANYIIGISTPFVRISLYIILGLAWGALGIVIARVATYFILFFITLIVWHFETRNGNINKDSLPEETGPDEI